MDTLLAIIVILVAYIYFSTPKGATIPFVPQDSPTSSFPPWLIFRPAIAINEFFKAAFDATTPPNVQVINLAFGYWKSEITYALTKNDIIDNLSNKPKTCSEIAQSLDLQEFAVCEYMKAGVLLGLLRTDSPGTGLYSLSSAGQLLRKDVPGSLRDVTLMINEETQLAWRAAGTRSIKSGKSGFLEAFGQEWWSWHNKHTNQEAQFDRAMTSLGVGATGVMLLDFHIPKEGVFCDIGGGVGTTAAIVLEHYPDLKAMVVDQPSVSKRANAYLAGKGVSDRAKAIGGDFFKPFPQDLATCDVFFLKFILHDWPDEESIDILKNILNVAKPGSKVAIMEQVLDTAGPNMETSKAMMSINMLSSNKYGAMERNVPHYAKLLKDAGYKNKVKLTELRDIFSVVEIIV